MHKLNTASVWYKTRTLPGFVGSLIRSSNLPQEIFIIEPINEIRIAFNVSLWINEAVKGLGDIWKLSFNVEMAEKIRY